MNKNAKSNIGSELSIVSASGIVADNEFEQDLFILLPKVMEIINKGLDVTVPISQHCEKLCISRRRFERLYNYAKKQQTEMTSLRVGEDQKFQLVHEADVEITRMLQEREEIINKRKEAEAKEIRMKGGSEETFTMADLSILSVKVHDFQRMINNIDQLVLKFQERKAKLLGVEVQKKVIITENAERLLKEMMERSKPKETIIDVEEVETI